MASSQEKISDKNFHLLENAIQDIISNKNTNTLLCEYTDFLLDELNVQKENEDILQGNLNKLKSIDDSIIETKCLELQGKVTDREKYLNHLREEMDNVTIESIADKETLKIEYKEKEQKVISYYETEVRKLRTQLENNKKEQEKAEQEIKNQITLEKATRKARLEEIRGNLQRQILEKNSFLNKIQNENKELIKELNSLKTQEKSNNHYTNVRSNVMEFQNDYLIHRNQTNVSKNSNEFNNVHPKRSATSEYSTTEYENYANNFAQPSIKRNTMNNNQNYITSVSSNNQLLKRDNPSNSNFFNSTEDRTNKNIVERNILTSPEISCFNVEYDQFSNTFTQPDTDTDMRNARIVNMVPNPYSLVTTAEKPTTNIRNDSLLTNKKRKVVAAKFSTLNSATPSTHNDSQMIEDPDTFEKDLIKKFKYFNYDSNPLDIPRKEPTVYMSEIRKKKGL